MECSAIILRGPNKGTLCGKEICGIHENSYRKHGALQIKRLETIAQKERLEENALSEHKKGNMTYPQYCNRLEQIEELFPIPPSDLSHVRDWKRNKRLDTLTRRRYHELIAEGLERGRQRIIRQQQELMDEAMFDHNPNTNLRVFASDAQNIHTTVVVKQTTAIVNAIRKIPVPPDYRWNIDICSKTPADIILHCNLSPKGALQLMREYGSEDTIYEMEAGIYGIVLDSVWQYICGSLDRQSLTVILKQEMEDNIGMCKQGNLTRICNILAGYIDLPIQVESIADILGRELSALMRDPDDVIRIARGRAILIREGVPASQWDTWLAPLKDV